MRTETGFACTPDDIDPPYAPYGPCRECRGEGTREPLPDDRVLVSQDELCERCFGTGEEPCPGVPHSRAEFDFALACEARGHGQSRFDGRGLGVMRCGVCGAIVEHSLPVLEAS